MLDVAARERFFKTGSGIAYIVNVEDGSTFIGIHVTKSFPGYRYDVIKYKFDGTCPGYDSKYEMIEPTTIKASGFTEWYEACMLAIHPIDNEHNGEIVTVTPERYNSMDSPLIERDSSSDVIFVVSPAPLDKYDRHSFMVCGIAELPSIHDIRKFGNLKLKNRILKNALGYVDLSECDNSENEQSPDVEISSEFGEWDEMPLTEDYKPKQVAMKSAVFELLETSNPEKFVLCNLETEEVFIIGKDELKDYIEI